MSKKRIAVVTARADSSEQKETILGISQAAFAAGADVAVFTNIYNHWVKDELLNYENIVYDLFVPEMFAGVIITAEAFMDLSVLDGVAEKIKKSRIPAVVIDGKIKGLKSIFFDDETDLEKITEHLITVHGFTDIDILTGFKNNYFSRKRVNGCKKALENHKLKFDSKKVHFGDFWTSSGEALAQKYINGEIPMPQAVICANNYMAYGICDALAAAGIAIPQKITIIGYDYNDERIYHYPLLTAYRRNRRKMGIDAVNMLLSKDYTEDESDQFIYGNTCTCGADSAQMSDEIFNARIGKYHTTMNSVAQLASRLTLCQTLAEYGNVLSDFFYLIYGADRLYVCLDKDWNSEKLFESEYICCKINGEKSEFFPKKLNKSELLTSLKKECEYPLLFYYLPLVFQKKSFGYAVLVYNYPQCYDINLRDFIKTAVNSLEFLRMKNDIHYLSQCQRESSLYDALTGFYNFKEFCDIILTNSKKDAINLLAVNFSFADDREYIFGETYQIDIIASAAAAIKNICINHEICCRTDNIFILMHDGGYFPDKLKAAIQCEMSCKFTERQVVISYADIENAGSKSAVGDVFSKIEEESILVVQNAERRKKLPHYDMLLNLKNEIMISPHKVCDIESVSRRFCISKGYFRTIYKNCFGISYVNDCINAKLSLAKYLLCTSSMSIYAIAMKCGYTDEKYFSRQFKENVGCSPLKYRNTLN